MITGVHHLSLSCSDAERSLAFYRDLFGMEVVSDRETEAGGFVERVTGIDGARVRIVHLHGHGLNLELLEYKAPRGAPKAREPNDAGSAHLCFVTDDIESDLARLAQAGAPLLSRGGPVTVSGGPNDGGRCAYVEDPDGNAVELVQLARPWPRDGRR
jgi:catechol 2,3-dioxygenase-like lactoylglutathione lyase family enzyme